MQYGPLTRLDGVGQAQGNPGGSDRAEDGGDPAKPFTAAQMNAPRTSPRSCPATSASRSQRPRPVHGARCRRCTRGRLPFGGHLPAPATSARAQRPDIVAPRQESIRALGAPVTPPEHPSSSTSPQASATSPSSPPPAARPPPPSSPRQPGTPGTPTPRTSPGGWTASSRARPPRPPRCRPASSSTSRPDGGRRAAHDTPAPRTGPRRTSEPVRQHARTETRRAAARCRDHARSPRSDPRPEGPSCSTDHQVR